MTNRTSRGHLSRHSANPPSAQHAQNRSAENRKRLQFLIPFSIALSVYCFSLAPDLTWAHHGIDGGDLITASYTLGSPHPSGYISYTLLGKLFSFVPLGTIAYRYNLFSALAMAAAVGVLTLVMTMPQGKRENRRWIPAIASSLSFGLAPAVWKQAIITEVYALNLLAIAIFLWTIVGRKSPFWQAVTWGFCLTTHLTSFLLLPILIYGFWQHRLRDRVSAETHRPKINLLNPLAGSLLGVSPILLFPLLAGGESPVVWGDATTLEGWWWLVSGAIYRPNVLHFGRILPQLTIGWWPTLLQFSLIGWLLIALGLLKERQNAFFWTLFGVALLYGLYALSYDSIDNAVFALPALLLMTPILYYGLKPGRIAALLLPLMALWLNFNMVTLHGDASLRATAQEALALLPPDAIMLTPGDKTIFVMWYLTFVEEQRGDIVPVDGNLFAFDWYRNRLQQRFPDLLVPGHDDLEQFRTDNSRFRPICDFSIDPIINLNCQ